MQETTDSDNENERKSKYVPSEDEIDTVQDQDENRHTQDKSLSKTNFRITLELQLIAEFLARTLSEGIVTIFILERTCSQTLGYSSELCEGFSDGSNVNKTLETEVQKEAASLIMLKSLFTNIIPLVGALFLGPLSDIQGRKPIIVSVMLGSILKYISYLIISSGLGIDHKYILVACFLSTCFGGASNFYSAACSYMSDITRPEDRSFRLAIIECTMGIGFVSGSLISPYLFKISRSNGFGYSLVFVTCALLSFLAFLHAIFILKESHIVQQHKKRISIDVLFYPWDLLKTCLKPRRGGGRTIIFLTTAAGCLNTICFDGTAEVELLYVLKQFNWTYSAFTIFKAVTFTYSAVGIIFGTKFLPYFFKMSDIQITMLSVLTFSLKHFIISFTPSNKDFLVYIAVATGFMSEAFVPCSRSIISSAIPQEDNGKIFAFIGAIGTFSMMFGQLSYTYIYTASIEFFPGTVYFLSAVLHIFIAFLIGYVAIIQKRHKQANSENFKIASDPLNDC